jgi:hypothetical protein
MPVSSRIKLSALLQACQTMERDLRTRGEVVGSLSRSLPEGLNSEVDLHDPALVSILTGHGPGMPDPCPTPPWCPTTYVTAAQNLGAGADRFVALVQALGLFYIQLPPELRPADPQP